MPETPAGSAPTSLTAGRIPSNRDEVQWVESRSAVVWAAQSRDFLSRLVRIDAQNQVGETCRRAPLWAASSRTRTVRPAMRRAGRIDPGRVHERIGAAGETIVREGLGWGAGLADVGNVNGWCRAVRPTMKPRVHLPSSCSQVGKSGLRSGGAIWSSPSPAVASRRPLATRRWRGPRRLTTCQSLACGSGLV